MILRTAIASLMISCALAGAVQADSMWTGDHISLSTANALDRVPSDYQAMVFAAAKSSPFSITLIDALIWAESGYDPDAVSKKGAQGLVQIMPKTARDLQLKNPFDAEANLAAGLTYLETQLNTFGSLPLALAAYNAGPAAVKRHKGIPPFPETQHYVAKVLKRAGLQLNPPRLAWRGAIGTARPQPTNSKTASKAKEIPNDPAA